MLNNIHLLSPELLLVSAISIQLVVAAIYSKLGKAVSTSLKIIWLSVISLLLAMFLLTNTLNANVDDLISINIIRVDPFTTAMKLAVCAVAFFVLIMATETMKQQRLENEFSIVLLCTALGFMILIGANELITLYLGIELYSLSSYVLAAFNRNSEKSTEAGLKYFVLGSLGSGIYLFGASLIYLVSGELTYEGIRIFLETSENSSLVILAAIFIIIALLFKMAAAPLHMWAPDVYEGSPTIVTSFFASAPKFAIFAALVHLLYSPLYPILTTLQPVLITASIFSMIIGAITGLNQTKIKRLVAYSSIANVGFILLGLSTCTLLGVQSSLIYAFIYVVTTISFFAAILITYKNTDFITELAGYSRRNPSLALALCLILFSFAGVPPLAGFYSKLVVLSEGMSNELYFLSFIALIASIIALVYYIRITKWMYFKDSTDFNPKIISDIIKPYSIDGIILPLILGASLYLIVSVLIFPLVWVKLANYLLLVSLV